MDAIYSVLTNAFRIVNFFESGKSMPLLLLINNTRSLFFLVIRLEHPLKLEQTQKTLGVCEE